MPRKVNTIQSTAPSRKAQQQEIIHCGQDVKYFLGRYVKIPHPKKGLVKFKTFPFQDNCLQAFQDHRYIIINKSRQLGLSTSAAAYALWLALFRREKNILIVATKLTTAQNFVKKVRTMLVNLPLWLVMPSLREDNKTSLSFSNGSTIKAVPCSEDAGRSEALSLLIVDEAAHIEGIDKMWTAMQPTLSCVAGNTLILTDEGFIPIEEFHKNKSIGDYFGLQIPVYGKKGMEKTSHGYVSPNHETYIITTKHGHSVECTPIHPLYSLQKSGLGEMTQAQNLKINDNLRIEVGQNCFGKTQLGPSLAYMLGGYTAEGWITKRKQKDGSYKYDSVEIENTDNGFRKVFLKSKCVKSFHEVPSRKTRLRCTSKALIEKYMSLGIDPHARCFQKTTPRAVLRGDKETVCSYLSGLFDGDGSVTSNGIVLSSTSKRLVEETNLLLHNLGFVSNVHYVKARTKDLGRVMPQGKPLLSLRDSWRLVVPRSQYKKFANTVGLKIQRKQVRLLKYSKIYDQTSCKLSPIPFDLVSTKLLNLFQRSGKTKKWFRKNGLRLDKCMDGHPNRKINKKWLMTFQSLLSEIDISFSTSDLEFFDEHIGSFYWDEIVKIEKSHNKTYDFTVPKTHSFLQNGILGSNTGGSVIMISSPSGVGTLFHRLWLDSQKGGSTDWHGLELPWTVHPERDEKWFQKESKALFLSEGQRGISQELLCSFQSSGDTFLKADAMDELFTQISSPIDKMTHGRFEVWIWKHPEPGHKYIIAADVARGDGADFSAFHILNTDTEEIVADYRGKSAPDAFAEMLVEYGEKYNRALICQEINNVGIACAQKLKDSKYPNLYYEKFQKNIYMTYVNQDIGPSDYPGFTTTTNSREQILAKLENAIRNKYIKVRSKRLYEELQTFIWKGNKPQAQKGHNDDLVMALAIACQLYQFSGKNSQSGADLQWAMVAGMSRNERTMNTTTGQTSDGFFSTNGRKNKNQHKPGSPHGLEGELERNKVTSLAPSKVHNYNDSAWDHIRWIFDD